MLPFCESVLAAWDGEQVRGHTGGIQAQATDDDGLLPGCVKNIHRGKRTVGDDDNGPFW